jgi:Xaa-Pro aminopeptidase
MANIFYYEKRLERMLKMMSDLSVDAALIAEPAAAQYFTGLNLAFLGVAMPTLITRQGKVFVFARPIEAAEAGDDALLGEVVEGPADPVRLEVFILEHLASLGIKKLGIDYTKTPYTLLQRLSGRLDTLKDIGSDLEKLRARKDLLELQNIIRAIAATEKAQARAKAMMSEGAMECAVSAAAVIEILNGGAEWFSFPPLVASGIRSAYPHGMPTQKQLRRGEMVFVDLGARFNGYWSDVTRTYVVGPADERQLKLYSVINEAIEVAEDAVRPGANARDVDASARRVIRRRGYGKYFVHGVGHGIGISPGYPVLGPSSHDVLEEGQTITIEPGIYIQNYGGIRIEEDVLVTKDGAHQLTTFPRSLE